MLSKFRQWLGNKNQREVKNILAHILPKIDKYYKSIQDTKALDQVSVELRTSLQEDSKRKEALYLAFAVVKEAVKRALGITMHDVQLIAGWILCQGDVAEMKTGEGKTIVSLLPAYWFGLQNKGLHMVNVNEYLAKRDYEEMSKVFKLLGLSVGLNLASMSEYEKRTAYLQDITYGTCTEFGFDYLRDHMVSEAEHRVQRALSFAIIDEIDSILIDEARTPLIIAGTSKAAPDLYYVCARFVRGFLEGRDYETDRESNQVMFTESAIRKIEAAFMIDNLYEVEYTVIYHYLLQSLRAKVLMHRDVDYMVADHKVHIVDAFTGRILEGRQFSEGLQQAIEAKENVPLSEENRTHATITIQKVFSLYNQIAGMSGTIQTDEEEMRRIYGLEVVSVPTHKPIIRQDYEDIIFLTKEIKYDRVIEEIRKRHAQSQPVLVGTTSVQQSEDIANRLSSLKVPYQILNAKTEQEEAKIIAGAGLKGAITIATNMAGRGTDIRLGEGVAQLGGLHVIGTERHESRRIDNQLRGRSGRQGDPGSSQFFLSLEDELIERFAKDEAEEFRESWQWGQEGFLGGKLQGFMGTVQRHVEQQLLSVRSMVFRFDTIIHDQRQAFYQQRNEVLQSEEWPARLSHSVVSYMTAFIHKYCPDHKVPEEWDIWQLKREFGAEGPFLHNIQDWQNSQKIIDQVVVEWTNRWDAYIAQREPSYWKQIWRPSYLQIIDRSWLDHLESLQQLKHGIHYQAYAQQDPVQAFQKEAWRLFNQMGDRIQKIVARKVMQELRDSTNEPIQRMNQVV
ncbi:preprotein translocase subunit SecA [Paenibacillus nasutitermitis]|uniref:Protein translocase subunit SecA n=1 Tax=Paenibacillus nasutitermitis TaxID=1652958 RepID=A0A916ZE54_9BACL|nr:preprotein translocase subunit SecA [Paenibacillus nasutitermitis]GGD91059.1 protein translocase subunit SecA 2 [Paenibacillus nasutitermitis]